MLRKILALSAALLALPPLLPLPGGNQIGALLAQDAGYRMRSSVMGAAGSAASGTDFRVAATLGQPTPTGILTGAGDILYAGFWGPLSALTPADNPEAPLANMLFQNYPNPFNPATTIRYTVPVGGRVELKVFNMLGQAVETLVDQEQKAGAYVVTFDASRLATGMYLYALRSGDFRIVKKMLLVK
jgi:hypothetical protein